MTELINFKLNNVYENEQFILERMKKKCQFCQRIKIKLKASNQIISNLH